MEVAAALQAYGQPLEVVSYLKYLGRFLTAPVNDWPMVVYNLRKARRKWDSMFKILGRGGGETPGPPTRFKRRTSRQPSCSYRRPGL